MYKLMRMRMAFRYNRFRGRHRGRGGGAKLLIAFPIQFSVLEVAGPPPPSQRSAEFKMNIVPFIGYFLIFSDFSEF